MRYINNISKQHLRRSKHLDMTNRTVPALFVFLSIGICTGHPCPTSNISHLKLSIFSLRNSTGHRISKMHLGHDTDNKDAGPILITMDQETKKFNESEEILIDVTAVVSPNLNEKRGPSLVQPKIKEVSMSGYKLLEGLGYYKIYAASSDGSWQRALKTCEDDGGYLLVVNSKDEADGLVALISKSAKPNLWHWIGFHDKYSEGNYVTIFNQTLEDAGYMKWGPGEPEEGPMLSCGVFNRAGNLGLHICTSVGTPYICEIDLPVK